MALDFLSFLTTHSPLSTPHFLAYTPFISPLPGVAAGWYLTLPPLCVAVAVVYKAIKCHRVSQIPREAAATAAWIFFGLVGAGAVLLGVLWLLGAL